MAESSKTSKLIIDAFSKEVPAVTETGEIAPEILNILQSCKLDLSQDIPDPEVLVSREGLPVCTRENFSVIVGLAGSRKTFLCTGIAASFLSERGCIGLEKASKGGSLLWVDTEQAAGHVARIGRRLNRLTGFPSNCNQPNITILCLREYQPDERRRIFDAALSLYEPDFAVLDGVSDLITDPNNSDQSSEIINHLLAVTKRFNCHVLTVIHSNVGSDKARGHLGSEALRKCETAILAIANNEITDCKFQKTRDMRPSDFAFSVNDGLPTAADFMPKQSKATKLSQGIADVMPQLPDVISHKDLCQKIMSAEGVKERTAKSRISEAVLQGLIIKNKSGMYHLPFAQDSTEIEMPF